MGAALRVYLDQGDDVDDDLLCNSQPQDHADVLVCHVIGDDEEEGNREGDAAKGTGHDRSGFEGDDHSNRLFKLQPSE